MYSTTGASGIGPNKQNPDSGIETVPQIEAREDAPGPNKQNPDSGIETVYNNWTAIRSFFVQTNRIPTQGLKLAARPGAGRRS